MKLRPGAALRVLRRSAAEPVDLALVLAVDCSGSISNENLALQFRGYAQAIMSDAFIAAVQSGLHARIALSFVIWSNADRQDVAVPWSLIDGRAAAGRFVTGLEKAPGAVPGYTSVSGAIDFSAKLLSACPYQPMRRTIDVSGDGANNDGRPATDARDDAIATGIVVNGLPILGEEANIADYYGRNVIGGPDAFLVVAADPASFQSAVLRKLITEVAALPCTAERLPQG